MEIEALESILMDDLEGNGDSSTMMNMYNSSDHM